MTDISVANTQVIVTPDESGNAVVQAGAIGIQGPPGGGAGSVDWADLTNKPSTFPPSAHSQTASTISDFATSVIGAVLTGFAAAGTRTAVTATDTVLAAFGKVQKYLNDLAAVAFSGSASDLTTGTLPAARFDDTAHGTRAGGTLHPAVTGSVNGFMIAADKTKLDGVATGATANATDAALRARTSHTGDDLTGAFGIADSTDPTKRTIFDATGLTTATVRTITLPNNSGQMIISAGAQTISGTKTFSAPPIMATPATGQASIRLPHGTAPTTPTDGDIWTTIDGLFARLNGATLNLAAQRDVAVIMPPAGQYVMTQGGIGGTSTGTLAGVADRLDLFPYLAPADFSIDQVITNCTTAVASALGKVVFYNSGSDGYPSTPITESPTMDYGTTGTKTAAVSVNFQAGKVYWIGIRHSSTATISAWASNATPDLMGGTTVWTTARKVMRRTVAFASAAPSPFNFVTTEFNAGPASAIWMRRA